MSRIQQAIAARMDAVRKGEAEKGFTLVELLVVIIIIGILAAIAVPVFLNVREGAWRSSVESDVHNAQLAVEQLAINNNGSVATLTATLSASGPITLGTSSQEVTVSEGNTITINASSATEYVITGVNTNLGTQTFTFNSSGAAGGWTP